VNIICNLIRLIVSFRKNLLRYAFTSALVSILNNGTALPMTGVMAACAVSAFIISIIGTG
jgi:hypothetical protein